MKVLIKRPSFEAFVKHQSVGNIIYTDQRMTNLHSEYSEKHPIECLIVDIIENEFILECEGDHLYMADLFKGMQIPYSAGGENAKEKDVFSILIAGAVGLALGKVFL